MIWCAIWSISGPHVFFDENLFGLLITFYSSILGGKLLELIRIPSVPQLPPLLGKGIISSNFFFIHLYVNYACILVKVNII